MKRTLLLLIAFFVLSLYLQAEAASTFVYCSEASPSIFNPQLATDGPTFNASSRTMYNRLVDFEAGGTKVGPSLAQKWTVSNDGLTFTFDLRTDVDFHATSYFTPSRKFNADDVIFTIERMRDKNHPFHKVSGGTYEYFNSMEMGTIIKEIKKITPHKIQFILSRPEAPFLANLAMDFASILSKEYADQMLKAGTATNVDSEPIGTGPFVFKRYVKDTMIRYTSHPTYFMGKAKVDNLVFAITTDPTVRYQKLKAGECHLATDPSPSDLEAIKANKALHIMSQAGLNVGYVAMNVEKAPFNKVLVRKAINHALNKENYIEAIYLGNARTAKNPIPPTMWSYNKKTKPYEYDLKKAKDLLTKAGYPNGFEVELWTLPVSRPYNPNGKKMGELIQSDLAKIGIKVKLVTYKWPTYLEKSGRGEHQMLQLGWTGDNGDPDNFLNVLLGCEAVKAGGNRARWCNQKFNHLISRAKVTTDIRTRSRFYQEAQDIFREEVPWVPIAHSVVFKAMTKSVKGYTMSPFGTDSFYGVELKK